MIEKIKKIKDTVKNVLMTKPSTRDNDQELILEVWKIQDSTFQYGSFSNFAEAFKSGKLANTESIRRSRQKLQEENVSLRGEFYKEKKALAEEVRQNINN